MSTKSITPKDVKPLAERRWQIDRCYEQRAAKTRTTPVPATPLRAQRKQRKGKSKKKAVYLTKLQHAELERGHIPKGVDWRTVSLSRKQRGLLSAARLRIMQAKDRTDALVLI